MKKIKDLKVGDTVYLYIADKSIGGYNLEISHIKEILERDSKKIKLSVYSERIDYNIITTYYDGSAYAECMVAGKMYIDYDFLLAHIEPKYQKYKELYEIMKANHPRKLKIKTILEND